ncbi:MAG: DUF5615 family PIN-like protein [Planctomycetes bacterium]|nr:DUF5615 family PIN-like protein [Planctomycetota bacterium]
MRFLVDRSAGRHLASWLRDRGHDVAEVAGRGADPGDPAILDWAVCEDRILVTIDMDFGRLVYREGKDHRGLVRLPDVPTPMRIAIMSALLLRHGGDLLTGAIITVRGSRIRVTPRRR